MSSYAELRAQAEELLRQAEAARKAELSNVIAEIKAKMKDFGLTVSDLGGVTGAKRGPKAEKAEKAAKYKGPNGELWAGGLGRKPEWVRNVLASGGNIEDFRIPESA